VRENPLPADGDQRRIETDKVQPKQRTAPGSVIRRDTHNHRGLGMNLPGKMRGVHVIIYNCMNERAFPISLGRRLSNRALLWWRLWVGAGTINSWSDAQDYS
jgi:hypothetical protein